MALCYAPQLQLSAERKTQQHRQRDDRARCPRHAGGRRGDDCVRGEYRPIKKGKAALELGHRVRLPRMHGRHRNTTRLSQAARLAARWRKSRPRSCREALLLSDRRSWITQADAAPRRLG